ncbi:MAG: glycosyltransferase [Patescibacteria group bacterium]
METIKKNILILHDRFQFRGGAERLILELAQGLEADILTEFWEDDSTYPRSEVPHELYVLDQGEPRPMVWRYFRAQLNFFFHTRHIIKKYDTVIFSGNNCLSAASHVKKGVKKVYYCHSPVRYVYDLYKHRRSQESSGFKRFFFYTLGKYLIRTIYRWGLAKMDVVISNSKNTQGRLKRYCGTSSEVVYPPIATDKFIWRGQEDYYLSFARLDELKRVDDIVRAFQIMPEKKLIIVSSGDEYDAILKLAEGYDNIEVKGWVDDEELQGLLGSCIATIYIPRDEDFGMTQIESISAGKPVVGVDEGGLAETIQDKVTGVLIPKDYTIEDIVKAVYYLDPQTCFEMRSDCEQYADQFKTTTFLDGVTKYL